MAASLLLTSGLARCEVVFHDCGTSPVCLFFAIGMVYHGGDMMFEMRRKPEPTLLLTQAIFSLPHHVGMV